MNIAIVVSLVSVLHACSSNDAPAERPATETATETAGDDVVEEDETPTGPSLEWLMLHDVQGLHGGRALYLLADGTAFVQLVTPTQTGGLQERRYETTLDAEARARIVSLLAEHDFATMEVEQRPGIPDEARAVLGVRLDDGTERVVAKWEGVTHAGFSALFGHLMRLANEGMAGDSTHTGDYAHEWRPPGADWPDLQ